MHMFSNNNNNNVTIDLCFRIWYEINWNRCINYVLKIIYITATCVYNIAIFCILLGLGLF